jgi:hypothetical protein
MRQRCHLNTFYINFGEARLREHSATPSKAHPCHVRVSFVCSFLPPARPPPSPTETPPRVLRLPPDPSETSLSRSPRVSNRRRCGRRATSRGELIEALLYILWLKLCSPPPFSRTRRDLSPLRRIAAVASSSWSSG